MDGRSLVEGPVDGTALILAEPLSFWGGLDPVTGEERWKMDPKIDRKRNAAEVTSRGARNASCA